MSPVRDNAFPYSKRGLIIMEAQILSAELRRETVA